MAKRSAIQRLRRAIVVDRIGRDSHLPVHKTACYLCARNAEAITTLLAAVEVELAELRKRPTLQEVLDRLLEYWIEVDSMRAIWAEDAEEAIRALYAERETGA